jgi:sporulation protein YlmC with PRC-barrel domain
MGHRPAALTVSLVVLLSCSDLRSDAWAQAADTARTETAARPTADATRAPSPIIIAKELQGLNVFGSEGQLVGKIARVNVFSDGTIKDVEIQSHGFMGLFSKTYVVPSDKLTKKGGRVDLSMTSEQAKQATK